MNTNDLIKALLIARPGAQWTVHSDGKIDWLDSNFSQPTEAELTAALKQVDLLSYREKRAANYPAIGDQLDAIMKGGQAFIDMQAMCMAVKAKFPKPS